MFGKLQCNEKSSTHPIPRRSRVSSRSFLVSLMLAFVVCLVAGIALTTRSGAAASAMAPPVLPANCTLPGVTVATDASGDETGAPAASQLDLTSVSIAEPFTTGSDHSITFTIKVANLTGGPQTNSTWSVYMNVTDTLGTTRNIFFDMNTVDSGTGAVGYNYGYHTAGPPAGDISQGAGSVITGSFAPDGTITLKVNTASPLSFSDNLAAHQFDVNLLPAGRNLTAVQGQTKLFVGVLGNGGSTTPDSTTTGSYTTIGNAACATGTPTPTPTPTATPTPSGTFGPVLLHFHGNPDDGTCAGQAPADIAACGGPFLKTTATLFAGPAARWDANSALDQATDQNQVDPSWIWNLSGSTTLRGAMPIQWWGTCGACSPGIFEAQWTIRLWADGVKVFETRIVGPTPPTPNVPALLSATVNIPTNITANTKWVLHVDPVFSDTQSNTKIYYDSQLACPGTTGGPCDSTVTMPVVDPASTPTPTPTPSPIPSPQPPGPSTPRFQNYTPPASNIFNGGEPSIGSDWVTGNAMYLASFSAIKIGFDDCSSPAKDTWTNTNAPAAASLDPIMFTDHIRASGDTTPDRTFVSQLTGQDSNTFFTDNDGGSYLPSQGGGIPSGVDHQTIGAGPYNAAATPPPPPHPTYPNAVYYCSQDAATSFCARSDDGGITFGAGVPMYNIAQCTGIHGHVKVARDGTVYVPNRSCGGKAAVVASTDNGVTWTVRPVPTSSSTGFLVDPSVGVGDNNTGKPAGQPSNTIYLGYQAADSHARVAVSRDRGATWVNDQDVGASLGLVNTTFPELVGGDDNRAAYAFFGTTVPGNYTDQASYAQDAPWHLYVATTFDAGLTWTTVDATPTDPVQRGSICNLGTTACMRTPNDRNLLDFMDETVDAQGRTLVGYPDGCVGGCVNNASGAHPNSYTARAAIARQSGGKRLFAAFDPNPAEPTAPPPPRVDNVFGDAATTHIRWSEPDNGGSPIIGYHVYRRTQPGTYSGPLATVPAGTTSYDDSTTVAGTQYFYKVTAINAIGEGLNCGEFPISSPPQTNPCTLPGVLVSTDPTGDQLLAPQNTDLDIQSVSVAEPFQSGGPNKLVFTLKVADLSTILPSRQWRILWTPPTAPTPGTDRYYVGMSSNSSASPTITFDFGQVTSNGNAPVPMGTSADPSPQISGTFTAAGVIQITVLNSAVGNPVAGTTLNNVSARATAGAPTSPIGAGNSIDASGLGSYTLVGNNACQPNTLPNAVLSASPTSGTAPLTVNFNGSASSDPDSGDSIASYKFNFGDGSAPVTCPSDPSCTGTGTASHTYNSAGNYNATLNVTDTHGGISENVAAVVISVAQGGTLTNYALASNGGLAAASSTYTSRSYPPEAANNGDRTGGGWEAGTGGWNDNTRSVWQDWLQVTFNLPKTVSEIRVYTLQNDFRNPVEPDPTTPADVYGILDFDVQYWDGAAWQIVPGGSVTGNNKAMRVFTFPAVTTTKVRVLVNNGRVYFSRIVELEAFGTPGQP